MFKFARKREVMWPVEIAVPVDGGTEKQEVGVRYRLLTRDERQAMEALPDDDSAMEFLVDHITGWDERWCDEDGNPLPFTAENLRAVLEHPYIERPISIGLLQASTGAARKNS